MTSPVGEQPDLTFVAPERRQMIRDRIAVIERYLALPGRTTGDAEDAARELGLSRVTFWTLVRIWKAHRRPEKLPGASNTKTVRLPKLHGDERFLEENLPKLDAAISTEQAVQAIERLAAAEGVHVRSRVSLRQFVGRWRRRRGCGPEPVAADLAIDHAVVSIPVDRDGTTMLPLATFLIHVPTGSALAATLSLDWPDPAVVGACLTAAIDAGRLVGGTGAAPTIRINGAGGAGWRALFDACKAGGLHRVGTDRSRVGSGEALKRFGGSLLGVKLHTRMVHRTPTDRTRSLDFNGTPVPIEEAQEMIDARIAAACPPSLRLGRGIGPVALALRLDRLKGAD